MNAGTLLAALRRPLTTAALVAFGAVAAEAQVFHARDLNTEQYKRIDRAKTVVIIPLGVLEEHGPYLPADTDGYIAEHVAREVAAAVARKGYTALMFPFVPLGTDAMNEVPGRRPWPGSFVIRSQTFRAMLMDLVTNIAEAGFRKVFVSNGHGAPTNVRMLTQVCAYFNETYDDGYMAVLGGFLGPRVQSPEAAKLQQEAAGLLSPEAKREQGGHADIDETSIMLFLQPHLVDPGYLEAPENTWGMMDSESWLGYL
ncbi:MAG TPA: creatininase family protein, partial [Candidatus Aminicenantes bacterium]|nr:creatininase family protein [Candidatus Aminicenantes bacterium]